MQRTRNAFSHVYAPHHHVPAERFSRHHKGKEIALDGQDNIFPWHKVHLTAQTFSYVRIAEIIPDGGEMVIGSPRQQVLQVVAATLIFNRFSAALVSHRQNGYQ